MLNEVNRMPHSPSPGFSSKVPSRIIVSVAACLVSILRPPTASSLIADAPLRRHVATSRPDVRIRKDTKLGGGSLGNEDDIFGEGDDDFASFRNYYFRRGEEDEDEGRRLAMEFYQELRHRRQDNSMPSHEYGDDEIENSDAAMTTGDGTTNPRSNDAAGVRRPRPSVLRAFATGPVTSSSSSSSSRMPSSSFPPFSLFPLLSLFPPNAPRPATSAGLFSGSGTTVYSSGRSIRAEIEILETSFKKNDDNDISDDGDWRRWVYVGNADDAVRLIALSLIVLSTLYVAVETTSAIGGMGMEIMTWDGAAASANRVMAIVNDGVSGVVVGVGGGGDVFVGEEAAWLLRESSEFAAIVVDAVRTVERLGSQLVR
jgi:hypothetical protein